MDRLFDIEDEPRGQTARTGAGPAAGRADAAGTVGEFVGQEHLLARGLGARTAIEEGRPHSMILYGPPGTGKTTLAACSPGARPRSRRPPRSRRRQEVREVIERAEHRRRPAASPRSSSSTRSTASTRPSRTRCCRPWRRAWSCWSAPPPRTPTSRPTRRSCRAAGSTSCGRSRTSTPSAAAPRARRRARDRRRADGGGRRLEFLAARSGGDARTALAALELAADTAATASDHRRRRRGCAPAQGRALRQGGRPPLRHDLRLDQGHARLGPGRLAPIPRDDARGRRGPALHRPADDGLASEDIGNADPRALEIAVAAAHAVEHVGLPECAHNLAQAAIHLALAPKSNASYGARPPRAAGSASTALPTSRLPRGAHYRAPRSATARATTTPTTAPRACPARS